MTALSYHERRAAPIAKRLAAAASLAARSPQPNVLYENRGAVSWAAGDRIELTARVDGTSMRVDGRVTEFAASASPLDAIGEALNALQLDRWRAYGWATFELSYALHGLDVGPRTPVAHLMIPACEVRMDADGTLLRALDPGDLDDLERRLASIRPGQRLPSPCPELEYHASDEYRIAVAHAVEEIRAHRLEKVILSRAVPVAGEIDFAGTYLAGRRGNDPARSFLLSLGGIEAAGFSPEVVAQVAADGTVTTEALAGTRALEGHARRDRDRREELCRDPKEVFEHAISVRLARDELAHVCAPGSVRVEDFMRVKERGSVQHLGSRLAGSLAPGRSGWDALAALFPAVTASGIPKAAACELIRRYESEPRGLYSGAVLTVDADGALDAALVLRAIFKRHGRTWLRAGAGIVQTSTPERELQETCEKLRSVTPYLVRAAASAPAPPVHRAVDAASAA
jgi:salicylate synthetase